MSRYTCAVEDGRPIDEVGRYHAEVERLWKAAEEWVADCEGGCFSHDDEACNFGECLDKPCEQKQAVEALRDVFGEETDE